jgi:integrase/recombinase XerC
MGQTIKELLGRYEVYAEAAAFSDAQIDHMRNCVRLFDQFLQGIKDIRKDIRDVTAADFRRFLADLRDRPLWRGLKKEQARHLSGTSINTYARAVKASFNWLKAEGIIADNPLAAVRVPRKPKTLPKVYSEKDLRAVNDAAAANIRDQAVFCVFLDSGIRLAELSSLEIGNVDTQTGILKVRGKGNKERFAYLGTDTAKCVDRYIKECRQGAAKGDPLFVTEDGQPLQARGVQSLLLRLGKKAGLDERLSAHKLRHSFATLSLKYGGNLEYIRKILGHTDIKTTSEAYLNVPDADVRAAYRRFSPMSNLQRAEPAEGSALAEEEEPADQQKSPQGKSGQKTHDVRSSEQIPLRTAKQEPVPKLAHDRSIGERERTEAIERPADADNSLRPSCWERYNEHQRKLADLTGELISDIENGNLEPPRRPARTKPKSMFGGLGLARVYHAQNNRLWPFLAQHLDNEFTAPRLTAQIDRVVVAALLARFPKNESEEKELADTVRENLILVSERGTFVGRCKICQSYFHGDGNT